jgi:nicotinate-nucleotide adenylyltransferase
MSTVIFGGSFNPPHSGHEALVDAIISLGVFRKVVIMPCFQSLYGKPLAPFEDRIAMAKLMVDGKYTEFSKVIVSDWEINNHDTNATIDLMDRIVNNNVFGDDEVRFVMGQDNAENIQKWVRWKELINKYKFVIVERGIPIVNDWYLDYPHIIIRLKGDYSKVSSTVYRTEKTEKIIKPSVLGYIKEKGLYLN